MSAIVIVGLLVALNALYVCAEFASVLVRRTRVEARANDGDTAARMLLPYVNDASSLDRYVAACQIGITASSLILGAYGQDTLAIWLEQWLARPGGLGMLTAETLATSAVLMLLTGLQVVLGELVPKAVAVRDPERVALVLVYPMIASLWLFAIFIRFLNGTGNLILSLLGVSTHAHRHVHSPEELDQVLAHTLEGDRMAPDEREQIRRVRRGLQFSTAVARDLMTPRTRIVAVERRVSRPALVGAFTASGYTRIPVYDGSIDTIVGMLHVKDVTLALAGARAVDVDALLRPLPMLPFGVRAEHVFRQIRDAGAHMVVLLDEYGGTAGLVTMEDLIEEVLGQLHDEFDRATEEVARDVDGSLLVRGTVPLTRLREEMPLMEQPSEIHTVGGLVQHLLGAASARKGDDVTWGGASFTVEDVRGRRIGRVRVRRAEGAD